jgi:hypothetical protein
VYKLLCPLLSSRPQLDNQIVVSILPLLVITSVTLVLLLVLVPNVLLVDMVTRLVFPHAFSVLLVLILLVLDSQHVPLLNQVLGLMDLVKQHH